MKRGLRANCNFYEDACNMSKKEINEVLEKYKQNKFDKLNQK